MGSSDLFRSLLAGNRQGIAARFLLVILGMFAIPYGLIVRLRALTYARGWLTVRRLACPVVSVGNITVGGTGKTPMVVAVARMLMDRGKRVAVLSRGYGGTLEGQTRIVSDGQRVFLTAREAGDEPVLLAREVPGLMVLIGVDRYAAGRLAEAQLAPDVFILDDGFQHLRMHRDLNILLMDSAAPLATGKLLPAGFLREPPAAIARAHLVVYTRCSGGTIPLVHGPLPAIRAEHRLVGVKRLGDDRLLSWDHLQGRTGVAFAGIADPASFFMALSGQGLQLAATVPLGDHCPYDNQVLSHVRHVSGHWGADYLITTAKDAVKLTATEGLAEIYMTVMELAMDRPDTLARFLDNLFPHDTLAQDW